MSAERCLGCYQSLDTPGTYHPRCSRKLFGSPNPPEVDFGMENIEKLARDALSHHLGITGVQPKVSVEIEKRRGPDQRLRIVGLWGGFILKPPSPRFPAMPVIEDLTMHLAALAGIETAAHGLIRLTTGELAYVTRRFDRQRSGKSVHRIAVEDFCQLSGLLTERKYKTSMEKAGKIIQQHSARPGLDLVAFLDLALFSYLTGNADMHLKNFSLIRLENGEYILAPAYDLVSTRLLPINDPEEMALTVNGKKSRLARADFEAMAETLRIPPKAMENSLKRLLTAVPTLRDAIRPSFLPDDLKTRYAGLIEERAAILGGAL